MKKDNKSVMEKAAGVIVDKRKVVYVIFALALIVCVVMMSRVRVNDDITSYLPWETETRQAVEIMNTEFVTYDTVTMMITNVTPSIAEDCAEKIRKVAGVREVAFENNSDNFRKSSALLEITLEKDGTNEDKLEIIDRAKEAISGYTTYTYSSTVNTKKKDLTDDIAAVLICSFFVIILVLLLTSQSFMEVPVFLIVFGVAALLNMGTNFIFGEISFITHSIAVVLQLALAIDYSIILSHRFAEEKRNGLSVRDAIVTALSKAVIEISSSSLTTIAGLAALMIMQLRIGMDMGLVLCKSIICSMLTVFLLMPGLLMLFSKWIDKTTHKPFLPDITGFGKIVLKGKRVVPLVFAVMMVAGIFFSSQCDYSFHEETVPPTKMSESQIAKNKIDEVFQIENNLAIIVPKGEYEKEAKILELAKEKPGVVSVMGLSATEINDDYHLTDKITPLQFSELTGVDIEMCRILFQAYGAKNEQYQAIFQDVDQYRICVMDLFMFVHEQMDLGVISLNADMTDTVNELYDKLSDAKEQLEGENYSRLIVKYSGKPEDEENIQLIDEIRSEAKKYYKNPIFASETNSSLDLKASFSSDNKKISLLTILAVLIILLFTFQSSVIPFILVLTIQGSIWINFSFPYLLGNKLYFLGYLVVSSIQMGATIDYAIVFANRYMTLKREKSPTEAAVQAINDSFPTIFTSGTIMTVAGFLVGLMSSNPIIASLGICLGRGTLISIFLVMLVLPQLMVALDKLVEKGAIERKKKDVARQDRTGTVYVDGRVRGYVNGYVDGTLRGLVRGEVHATMDIGGSDEEKPLPEQEEKGVEPYEEKV